MQQTGPHNSTNRERTSRKLVETATRHLLLILALVALSVVSNLVGYYKVVVVVDRTSSSKKNAEDHPHYLTVEKEKHRQRHTQRQTSLEDRFLQNYSGLLPPIWPTCMIDTNDSSNNTAATGRLFFVHVFKTAGSSFRSFFLDHVGPICRKGVVEVAGCSQLSHASAANGNNYAIWKATNGSKDGCYAPHTQSRYHSDKNSDKNATRTVWKLRPLTRQWLEHHGDIVAGHQPLGLYAYLDNDESNDHSSTYRYITFFREPVAKYVSGRLYLNHHAQHSDWSSIDEAAAAIQARVLRVTQNKNEMSGESSYYNAYEGYLTTPAQKEEIIRNNLTGSGIVDLIASNLVQLNVLVGLVERMDTSLALLQSILDPKQQLTASLQFLNTKHNNNNNNNRGSLVMNQSRLSTTAIVKQLLFNSTFVETLQGYLRHELRLYAFAQALHERQVQLLRRQHGDRYFRPFVVDS